MDHPSLRYLHGEAAALDLEAARIDQGLSLGLSMETLAADCIQRASDRIGPMLSEEKATLSAVLKEHDPSQPALEREAAARERVHEACDALEDALNEGGDCEAHLESYARNLHAYAQIELQEIAPAARAAGDRVLREADFRVRAYGKAQPEVAVGEDLWNATP